jgi:OOP family OmpA-OmpF porin
MATSRSLLFTLCACVLLGPLATLVAQEMQEMQDDTMTDDGSFYISGAYSAALPGERDVFDESNRVSDGTGFGLLGGQIGVGYAIAGFRPEISVGYRMASVNSLKAKKLGSTADADLKSINDMLAEAGPQVAGSVVSVDLAAGVYYDIDTGTAVTPYIGVGGGMSQVTVKVKQTLTPLVPDHDDSLWALSFQAAAGIGYAVMDELTLTLGYRLIGTLEGNFSKYDTSKTKMGMTLNHNVELGVRYSF